MPSSVSSRIYSEISLWGDAEFDGDLLLPDRRLVLGDLDQDL